MQCLLIYKKNELTYDRSGIIKSYHQFLSIELNLHYENQAIVSGAAYL